MSSFLSGVVGPRAVALDVNNPIVQEVAQMAKVQFVAISQLETRDSINHNQFVSLAVLYSRIQQLKHNRASVGTCIFNAGITTLQTADSETRALAQ